MAQYDDTKVAKVSNILILGSILTILFVLGTQALYHVVDSELTEDRVTNTVFEEVKGLEAWQTKKLHSYSLDKASKKITIDIDQAMKLVVRDLNK
jgi:hypothetical protein